MAGAVERLTPEEIAKLPRTDKGLIDSKHLPSEIKEALRGVDRGDKRDIFGKYVQKMIKRKEQQIQKPEVSTCCWQLCGAKGMW
ncbi:hypothetical protein [Buchananella hordeovulneris]|uniref:hypothetical protein n=1 Tax=Buchananella hordeovulneris TaxID=52770 RepID=UPI0026DB5E52|nr:hypothetical protein [Buchananella hordeovulneris]MDO5081241.1 hypothetical protein [Buchananella hordeovulneris]